MLMLNIPSYNKNLKKNRKRVYKNDFGKRLIFLEKIEITSNAKK